MLELGMRVGILIGLSLLLACARPEAQTPVPSSAPVITRLDPDSGPPGTVVGTGFADTGNVITFAGISVPGLASTLGGTRIVFTAPSGQPTATEAAPMRLVGLFEVTVTTPTGTSPPAHFTITPSGGY